MRMPFKQKECVRLRTMIVTASISASSDKSGISIFPTIQHQLPPSVKTTRNAPLGLNSPALESHQLTKTIF